MAVAVNSVGQSNYNSTNTGSTAFTAPTGTTDLILLVCMIGYSPSNQVRGSTMTWNGVSMTMIASQYEDDAAAFGAGDHRGIEFWWLPAPATGSNTLATTLVNSVDNFSTFVAFVTGAHQTTQPDASGGHVSTATEDPMTLTITTTADNCLPFSGANSGNLGSIVQGGSQTKWGSTYSDFVFTSYSSSLKTPAGSVSHTYSNGTSELYVGLMISVQPPAGGGGGTTVVPVPSLAYLGVG